MTIIHLESQLSRSFVMRAMSFLFLIMAAGAFATQPVRFNYQARLTDGSGTALQGAHTLYLSLWDGGTSVAASSGTERFAETATVTITGGVVNYAVGSGTNTFGGDLSQV